jgi:DNA-binding CsgD family transcriptional regulator/tetratricopeptide (TPR) repeat protein
VISEPVLCRSFVGRVAELEHFVARRRAAAAGRGGTILVAGEAGVGKSRLLAEFRATLPRRTTRVGWSACREFAQRPLGPWLEVLGALEPRAAATLASHAFPSKDEQMAALVETFERLAARSTTIVVLEDLHWADPDIMRVLLVLTERALDQRMLFVGTYRDDELIAGHPSFVLLGRLLRDRAASLVKLTTFDEREMMQLLRDALPPEPSLPEETLRDVRRRADGNALFGEELLRHAIDRNRYGATGVTDPLPLSLDAIIRERLTRCDPEDRDLLTRASLFGRTFDIDVLADAFGTAVGRCRSAMERLAALQLVDPTDAQASEYRFRHALTRDVIYAEIPKVDLPLLHERLAHAITARGATDAHVEWLAHHYRLAGDGQRAAPFCMAAGDAAQAVHAYEDAAAWYERAAEAYPGAVESAAALVRAGLMQVFCNDVDRALRCYERAAATYEGAARVDDAIVARVMAAGALYNGGRVDDSIAFLEETRERLAARAGPEFRDRLIVRLGFSYAFARRDREAWAAAQEIGDETLESPTPLGAEANFLRSALHAQRAEPHDWRARLERGLEIFERSGALPDNIRAALSNGAAQALALGESALARSYQTRAYDLARKLNVHVDYEGLLLAEIELRCGNLDGARSLLQAHSAPAKFNARVPRAVLGVSIATLRGDDDLDSLVDMTLLDEARRNGHEAATIALSTAYAAAFETRGRAAQVERLLRGAAALISTAYDMTVPIAAIARLRPGLAAPLKPLVDRAAERASDRVAQALQSFVEAALARDRGDAGAARSAGLRAAALFAAIGWPLLEAQAFEVGGDDAAARRAYRSLGASAEARRLERDFGAEDAPGLQTSLTPRERELVRIIADGKSNRAAAAALSVSEKSIEKHLTSIYAKLGMTSRAQLAAFAASRRANGA